MRHGFRSGQPATVASMQLRALTLNVWGLPFGLTRHHDARMRAIGEGFGRWEADVIALQEVWTEDARKMLAAAGRRAGYSALWHREAAFGGSGLMVLSRLPIINQHFTRYRLAGLPQRPFHGDYYSGKGFVQLALSTDLGPISLLDTHMQANYSGPGERDEYRGIRASQAIELAAAVRPIPEPVLALGDFNTREGEAAYAILGDIGGLRDVAAVLDRRQATCLASHPYRAAGAGEARIDLVLARDGGGLALRDIAIERVFDEPVEFAGEPGAYSDHAGVLATFELERRRVPLLGFGAEEGAGVDAAALDRAQAELSLGARWARQRRNGEYRIAGAGLAAGLLMGGGAWRARTGRRRFLAGGLATLAGLGVGGGFLGALASRQVTEKELADFAEVEKILAGLRADAPRPVRIGSP